MIAARRAFTQFLVAAPAVVVFAFNGVRAQSLPGRSTPSTNDFEDGDFIWPRPADKVIPYGSDPYDPRVFEQKTWERGRDTYVAAVRADSRSSVRVLEVANLLEATTYSAFLDQYESGNAGKIPELFGDDSKLPVYVGHVGIVFHDGSQWNVVEAVLTKDIHAVRTIPYADWLNERKGQLVWHGRLKGRSLSDRAKIAKAALAYSGKPYDFWDFNLSHTSGFYCSKLVWLATMDALSVPIDGNANPDRLIWISPKQVLLAPAVQILFSPAGSYGLPAAGRG